MYLSAIKCKQKRVKPLFFVPQLIKVQQRYKITRNKQIIKQNKH